MGEDKLWLVVVSAACVLTTTGCRGKAPEFPRASTEAASVLAARHGVLLLYGPTCRITGETIQALNRLDSVPGIGMTAVALTNFPGDEEWRTTFPATGLQMPIRPPDPYWTAFVAHQGVVPPVLVVLRFGRVVAIFTGDAEMAGNALPALFDLP